MSDNALGRNSPELLPDLAQQIKTAPPNEEPAVEYKDGERADDERADDDSASDAGQLSDDKLNGDAFRWRPHSESMTEEITSDIGTSRDEGLSIEHGLETVYVEQKNGTFKPTSTCNLNMFPGNQCRRDCNKNSRCCIRTALDMAVLVQKLWYCLSNFCFGILAGVAALHLIIMFSTLPISKQDPEANIKTVKLYSNTAFILPILFYVCLTLCLISLFDRFDTSQLEDDDLKDTYSYKFTWIIIVIYLTVFLLHLLTARYDDMFVLYEHDDSFAYPPQRLMSELTVWRWLDGSKCVLCLLAWMMVSLVPTKDFLLHHLKYLKTYDLDPIS